MVDVDSRLDAIEAELWENLRLNEVERRDLEGEIAVIKRAKAEVAALRGRQGGGGVASGSSGAERPSDEPFVEVIIGLGGGVDDYLVPEYDQNTHEPVYDPRVVAGKRTYRERAFAAARVYGMELREAALATAIFETGDTKAAGAPTVRSSLGSLVRYGHEWVRIKGSLYYLGDSLTPYEEMVRLLYTERTVTSDQTEDTKVAQNG